MRVQLYYIGLTNMNVYDLAQREIRSPKCDSPITYVCILGGYRHMVNARSHILQTTDRNQCLHENIP